MRCLDKTLVAFGCDHIVGPQTIGGGAHDCALAALYWAAPKLSEKDIRQAFLYCSNEWPYAGVFNTEFAITLKYLGLQNTYYGHDDTLGNVARKRYKHCVALLRGHYVALLNGSLAGKDAKGTFLKSAKVECYWVL